MKTVKVFPVEVLLYMVNNLIIAVFDPSTSHKSISMKLLTP